MTGQQHDPFFVTLAGETLDFERYLAGRLPSLVNMSRDHGVRSALNLALDTARDNIDRVEREIILVAGKTVTRESAAVRGLFDDIDDVLDGDAAAAIVDPAMVQRITEINVFEQRRYRVLGNLANTLGLAETSAAMDRSKAALAELEEVLDRCWNRLAQSYRAAPANA